ncbi:MAG: histidinol phosphate phosphatase [Polyangiaceae bacterium]|nr:histidinol phosphate phosphatase [Polyangiaceae bacterium]
MSEEAFDLDRIGGRNALRALISEVLAAGEDALKLYSRGAAARVQAKPDRSPVTEADRAVEERIRAYLAKHFPMAAFLGEETGSANGSSGLRFIVDPIDGTRAFIRGLSTWSILVGLEAEGEPVVGIAYMPAAEELYVGVRGGGADCNGRPLHVSAVSSLDAALVCHGSLQQFTDESLGPVLTRLGEQVYTCRGLADFDGYRQVLHGRADAMVDPSIKPYDVCPAAVLVREAGGRFTSLSGEATIFGGSGLASNGHVHEALVALVAG